MKTYFTPLAILLSLALFSCNSDDVVDKPEKPEIPETPITYLFPEKIERDNTFTFDLLRSTNKHSKEKNVFISPISVSLAINMVLNGAEGNTKTEIQEALRAKEYSISDINSHSKELCSQLNTASKGETTYIAKYEKTKTDFLIANSIWYHNDLGSFPVKKEFVTVNKTYYDAEVKETNFNSPDALSLINGWCAEKTNQKINKVLESINSQTIMYIINAVYFKGDWRHYFREEMTETDIFYMEDGNKSNVDMMRMYNYFNYNEDVDCQYINLPYENDNYGMTVLLPKTGKTTKDIIQKIDNNSWSAINSGLKSKYVCIKLPRFKFECRYEMQNNILPDMGMKTPFTINADFSKISDIKGLCISKVIHNTFIELNERGTEAAGTTVIGMETGEGSLPPTPIDFIVNKPFVFAIHEKTTGAILFIGKVGEIK